MVRYISMDTFNSPVTLDWSNGRVFSDVLLEYREYLAFCKL